MLFFPFLFRLILPFEVELCLVGNEEIPVIWELHPNWFFCNRLGYSSQWECAFEDVKQVPGSVVIEVHSYTFANDSKLLNHTLPEIETREISF
jgi:hypothetical protein